MWGLLPVPPRSDAGTSEGDLLHGALKSISGALRASGRSGREDDQGLSQAPQRPRVAHLTFDPRRRCTLVACGTGIGRLGGCRSRRICVAPAARSRQIRLPACAGRSPCPKPPCATTPLPWMLPYRSGGHSQPARLAVGGMRGPHRRLRRLARDHAHGSGWRALQVARSGAAGNACVEVYVQAAAARFPAASSAAVPAAQARGPSLAPLRQRRPGPG